MKLMNNAVFRKNSENARKHRHVKLVTTNKRRSSITTKLSYNKMLLRKPFETKEINVKMKKQVYLGLLILDMSKVAMYELWYDYVKPKSGGNAKLCYMDTDSFDLRKDLIHQTMKLKEHHPWLKIRKL